MNRRSLLKYLGVAPLMAVPVPAIAIYQAPKVVRLTSKLTDEQAQQLRAVWQDEQQWRFGRNGIITLPAR